MVTAVLGQNKDTKIAQQNLSKRAQNRSPVTLLEEQSYLD